MVPECFTPADDISAFVNQERGGHGNGNPFLIAVDDIAGGADKGFSYLHGLFQCTFRLTHIRSEYLPAMPSDGFFARNTGDLFRSPVKRGYFPTVINGKHPVGNTFEDNFGGFFIQGAENIFVHF